MMDEYLDNLPVELRPETPKLVQCPRHRLIAFRYGRSVVIASKGIRHRDDPCDERDVRPLEPVGIARAVVFFMVAPHARYHIFQLLHVSQNISAVSRMTVHHCQFALIEPAALQQDTVAHADLPDIMQDRSELQVLQHSLVQPHHPADGQAVLHHSAGMSPCVRILFIDGLGQCLHGIVKCVLQFLVQMHVFYERGKDEPNAPEELEILFAVSARDPLVEIDEAGNNLPVMDEGDA